MTPVFPGWIVTFVTTPTDNPDGNNVDCADVTIWSPTSTLVPASNWTERSREPRPDAIPVAAGDPLCPGVCTPTEKPGSVSTWIFAPPSQTWITLPTIPCGEMTGMSSAMAASDPLSIVRVGSKLPSSLPTIDAVTFFTRSAFCSSSDAFRSEFSLIASAAAVCCPRRPAISCSSSRFFCLRSPELVTPSHQSPTGRATLSAAL